MSTVRIPVGDFERGGLPRVCAVTGRPDADIAWNRTATDDAGALRILLLFGIFPYLIARALTKRTVRGNLWLSEEGMQWARARQRSFDVRRLSVFVAAIASMVAALGLASTPSRAAFVLVLVALTAIAASAFLPVDVMPLQLESSGRWVRAAGVHRDAATAVETSGRDEASRV